jgi:hypothetical protein
MDKPNGMRARMTFKGIQLAGFCPFLVFFSKISVRIRAVRVIRVSLLVFFMKVSGG